MRSLNQKQKTAAGSPGLKFIAVSAVAVTTALFSAPHATAAPHTPLTRTDAPAAPAEALLGDPRGPAIAAAIEERVMDGRIDTLLGEHVSPGAKVAARTAYAQGVFAPIWTESSAKALLEANTRKSGFTNRQLRKLVKQRFDGSDAKAAEADLKLTAAWMRLASVKSDGLSDEGEMVKSTPARITRSDLVMSLRDAGQNDPIAAMSSVSERPPQYRALEAKLKDYIQFAENGGWKQIRDDDEMLEPGMSDPRVPALRQRLAAEGYVEQSPFQPIYAAVNAADADVDPTYYDDALVKRVEVFQAAHGLAQDGVLGPATLAALNESVESKIDRMERAMNYWRENADPGERYIWVNIPSYRAEAWTGDRRDIAMDTIVGKKRTPTTAFSDEIEYVVVNPKWFLPIGLFKRQKLRKLRKDPGYAAANNYVVYNRASGEELDPYAVDWTEPGIARTIKMVQTPGPHNALGQLKIIFPNKHAIYLHDTPSRHLFDRDVRALSSGCIRLDDPVKMANWLTDGDTGVATNVFNATLESRERERFYLDKHVPVHLTYLPAVVNPDGQAEFPADIYGEFTKPTLASGTYADHLETDDARELLVDTDDTTSAAGQGTRTLQ